MPDAVITTKELAWAVWAHGAANWRTIIDGWNGLSFFEQTIVGLMVVIALIGSRILGALQRGGKQHR